MHGETGSMMMGKRPGKRPGKAALLRVCLLLACGLGVGAASAAAIERVEPPFWWLGFEHPQLQLLIYGEEIAQLKPSIKEPGVTLEKATATGNPNYLFLHLRIGPQARPGTFRIRFSDGKRSLTHRYRLEARNADPSHTQGFSAADAIYLITPDRFANGDPGNDQVAGLGDLVDRAQPGARHGGDLKGLRERLDYIAGLGFTAIWLNPVLENAMPQYSYHGYATTDFYRVDPRFGSNEELAALAQAGRERGVGLIMDMIVNHCGLHHWWMADPPSEDWVHRWNGYVETSHAKTLSLDPYAAEADRRVFYDGWFVPDMPDLNQDNPLLAEYLIQNAIWWIERLGLAGVRMDTYPYSGKAFMAEWTRRVMQEFPQFNIVGEEWTTNPLIVAHWQRGGDKTGGYQSWLPSVMDFPLQSVLASSLRDEEKFAQGLPSLYAMLVNDRLYADPNALVIFGDNHDIRRLYSQLGEDYGLFELALAYLATMRGTPQIYYGTEILAASGGDHGIIRSDFPGGWPGDAADAVSGKGLTHGQRQAQSLVRKLFTWRKGQPAIHRGTLKHFLPKDGVYVYFRALEDDLIMVALNKNRGPRSLDLARFREALGDARSGMDMIRGDAFDLTRPIGLRPRSALVLEVE